MKEKILRVGEITYTNCDHLYYCLKKKVPLSGVEFIPGTPSRLNSLLRSGRLDLSLSSSVEYARNSGEYLILPDFCIGASGPVPSIRLFSHLPLEKLDQAKILLSDESATTAALCRIILGHFLNFSNEFLPHGAGLDGDLEEDGAILLIGDRALEAGFRAKELYCHDLSTIWREHTGLPFVFALWTLRADSLEARRKVLARFWSALSEAHKLIDRPEKDVIQHVLAEKSFLSHLLSFSREDLIRYWSLISYALTEDHIRGLELFYSLAHEWAGFPPPPALRFYNPGK